MSKIARLRPLNVRKGLVLRTYTVFGITFKVEAGWYEVSDEVAKVLKTIHQSAENDESPLAFEVYDKAEDALAADAAEKRRQREHAEATDPHRVHRVTARGDVRPPREPISPAERSTLTTRDLPRADTTDNLPGSEDDLESTDLASDVERATPKRPTRLVSPDDPDTAVEGGAADEGAEPAPPTAPTPTTATAPISIPGRRRTGATSATKAPAAPKAPEPPKGEGGGEG